MVLARKRPDIDIYDLTKAFAVRIMHLYQYLSRLIT